MLRKSEHKNFNYHDIDGWFAGSTLKKKWEFIFWVYYSGCCYIYYQIHMPLNWISSKMDHIHCKNDRKYKINSLNVFVQIVDTWVYINK